MLCCAVLCCAVLQAVCIEVSKRWRRAPSWAADPPTARPTPSVSRWHEKGFKCTGVSKNQHCSLLVLLCLVMPCIAYALLYSSLLYCTVLYCTVLYCTVLYCTVLYCTVLYCTVLYCTVLHCTVPHQDCWGIENI